LDNPERIALSKVSNKYQRNKLRILGVTIFISFILGWMATGKFQMGFVFVVGSLMLLFRLEQLIVGQTSTDAGGMFSGSGKFDDALIVLIAAVIKSDGKISKEEIDTVERKLRKEYFSSDFAILTRKLKIELDKKQIDIENETEFVAAEFSASDKVQLLHFLVRIAVSDGYLSQSEEQMLQQITAKIQVPYRTLDSLLAMHRFKREQDEQDRQNYQERKKYTSVSQLENAYKILEILPSCSDKEIKKAYKRLAILHHPDKVAHLGEEIQKSAADKFKIIVGAYDLICKKRNIV
jgi:DnaJ like chaperone protein